MQKLLQWEIDRIAGQRNATEEEGDKANDEHNAVNATITLQSIISAQSLREL